MEGRKEYSEEEPEEGREISTADLASRSAPETRSDDERDYARDDRVLQSDEVSARQEVSVQNEAVLDQGERKGTKDETTDSLLPDDAAKGFGERWEEIQTSFVDEPRTSVEAADQLVAEVMQRLAESFARERSDLEQQWDRGEDVSTEDLRVALQRYRSFFQRLLAA
jgi:hypothetical protein